MEITTAQIELLACEEPSNYINFTNSEFFKKDTFKSIYEEIVSHGHIFDIILDRGSNNYTRPIEALSVEEALSLKMLMADKYDATEILKNAVQYKNIRLLFVNVPDKDSYYYLEKFTHNNEFYISIILLKDFPADETSNIQYSIIRDVIQLYFALSFKKLNIPVNYDERINNEVICFNTLRASDFIFISYYFAYYLEALSVFIPISAIENTINEDGLSLLIDNYDNASKVLHNRDKVINGNASDLVDYAYMIAKSYFNSIIQIASLDNTAIMVDAADQSVIESEEGNTDD